MTEIKIENKTYRINELPNTENKDILEFLIYLKELHSICRELFLCLIQENKKVKTTIGFVGSLIDRISESLISIMLLASKGFATDVAILLVNLIELRTDLKYISKNPKKIDEWFNHGKRWKKPWKFSKQIKDIASDDKELEEVEKNIYEFCSIAKHGNPIGYDIGFDLGLKDNGIYIVLDTDYRLNDYLFWTYLYTSDAIKSSLVIVERFQIVPQNITDKLENVSAKIGGLYEKVISKKVMKYVYEMNPELMEIDKKLEVLKRKQKRVKAKIEEIEKQIKK
jgi:hypothetical protein